VAVKTGHVYDFYETDITDYDDNVTLRTGVGKYTENVREMFACSCIDVVTAAKSSDASRVSRTVQPPPLVITHPRPRQSLVGGGRVFTAVVCLCVCFFRTISQKPMQL